MIVLFIDCFQEVGEFFDNLKYWQSLASLLQDQGCVVYGGEQSMQTGNGALISWRNLDRIQG